MSARIGLPVALVFSSLLGACQSCGQFRAAWYLVEGDGKPEMRVAVLNESKTSKELSRVVLNPDSAAATGWKTFDNMSKQLAVGEILVLPGIPVEAGPKTSKSCRVPVSVAVQCKGSDRVTWAAVSGTLPNYLPTDWLDWCGQWTASP
jgi:hypothetical protein